MKSLKLPEPEKSAKTFLIKTLPVILASLGVEPVQSFYGFRVNIASELTKRINAMPESKAKFVLDQLRDLMLEW